MTDDENTLLSLRENSTLTEDKALDAGREVNKRLRERYLPPSNTYEIPGYIVFENEDELRLLLGDIGYIIQDNFLYPKKTPILRCSACNIPLNISNISRILPKDDDYIFFCDNIMCSLNPSWGD